MSGNSAGAHRQCNHFVGGGVRCREHRSDRRLHCHSSRNVRPSDHPPSEFARKLTSRRLFCQFLNLVIRRLEPPPTWRRTLWQWKD